MLNSILAAVALALSAQSPVPNRTNGDCSPIVVSAQSVTVAGCGIGTVAARRLQDSINRAITQNNLTLAQTRVVATILNGLVLQTTLSNEKLDRIINYIEGRGGIEGRRGTTMGATSSGLIPEVLDRTVQRVDNLKITVTKIEAGVNRISVSFDLVNEGIVEYRRLNIFGGGSFGNGGSSLVLGGNEVIATGIQFAGNSNRGIVRSDIVPRVRYSGRVDFDGIYGDIDSVDVFRLALSNNNLRPSARATFILSN
jgi:hypothetical protein